MIKVFVEVDIVRLMEVYEKINVKKKKSLQNPSVCTVLLLGMNSPSSGIGTKSVPCSFLFHGSFLFFPAAPNSRVCSFLRNEEMIYFIP